MTLSKLIHGIPSASVVLVVLLVVFASCAQHLTVEALGISSVCNGPPPLIINVGLPRTGTWSFHEVMQSLNYSSIHLLTVCLCRVSHHDDVCLLRFTMPLTSDPSRYSLTFAPLLCVLFVCYVLLPVYCHSKPRTQRRNDWSRTSAKSRRSAALATVRC